MQVEKINANTVKTMSNFFAFFINCFPPLYF
jgi:hypothetical protein